LFTQPLFYRTSWALPMGDKEGISPNVDDNPDEPEAGHDCLTT